MRRAVLVIPFLITGLNVFGQMMDQNPVIQTHKLPAPVVSYNRDVRPILSDACFPCHGPDSNKRQAGLRLDMRGEAISRKAIVAGSTTGSLWSRITHKVSGLKMPPSSTHKDLSPAQISTLKAWLLSGAGYEEHWAYTKRVMPPLPKGIAGTTNIDRFINAKQRQRNLSALQAAKPATLLRRLALDLTGLPPTQKDMTAFVAQPSRINYSKLVDTYLASSAHAERLATFWLDQVRYADTVGFHGDQNQNAWPYRDWVIDAFRSNMPYDVFIRDQIAGDLLPNATDATRTATCFNRLNMVTREGGAQPGEYLAKYAADRVRTVGSAFLGSTIGCAECHDHKYDPFTSRDFYAMAAFFADIRQWGVYADYSYTPEPELRGINNDSPFPPEHMIQSVPLTERIRREIRALNDYAERMDSNQATVQTYKNSAYDVFVAPLVRGTGASSVLVKNPNGNVAYQPEKLKINVDVPSDIGLVSGLEIEFIPPKTGQKPVTFSLIQGTSEVTFSHGVGLPHIPITENGASRIGIQSGWRIPDDSTGTPSRAILWLPKTLFTRNGPIRFSVSGVTTPVTVRVHTVHMVNLDTLSKQPVPGVNLAFLLSGLGDAPSVLDVAMRQRAITECRQGITPVMVTLALAKPKETRVLSRGNWMDTSGDIVVPQPPSFLAKASMKPQASVEGRKSRLDLAQWITDPSNPLTARVIVNRLWKLFFGTGLSASVEDFGSQGEPPTHPELLDYLAQSLINHKWNLRATLREIVLSDAYQRSSTPTPTLLLNDPQNKFLTRQTARRLDAEFIRDNALAIAGLLDTTVGGPPVKPYQPVGYYTNIQFPDRDYVPSTGGDQYRRGIYTHWQRTFLQPSLAAFDAPSREEACPVRTEANTPQQALTLLNDPTYIEAARVLAQTTLLQKNRLGRATIADATVVLQLLDRVRGGRPLRANHSDVTTLLDLLSSARRHYSNNMSDARRLIGVGMYPLSLEIDARELASWTNVCRALLNLHETITRY